jgi:hypothetical protein
MRSSSQIQRGSDQRFPSHRLAGHCGETPLGSEHPDAGEPVCKFKKNQHAVVDQARRVAFRIIQRRHLTDSCLFREGAQCVSIGIAVVARFHPLISSLAPPCAALAG